MPEWYFEHKRQQVEAMRNSFGAIESVGKEFGELSGRPYGFLEGYRMEDAECAIVALGSTCGTARVAADEAREQGIKAGVLKLRVFRPFPARQLRQALGAREDRRRPRPLDLVRHRGRPAVPRGPLAPLRRRPARSCRSSTASADATSASSRSSKSSRPCATPARSGLKEREVEFIGLARIARSPGLGSNRRMTEHGHQPSRSSRRNRTSSPAGTRRAPAAPGRRSCARRCWPRRRRSSRVPPPAAWKW